MTQSEWSRQANTLTASIRRIEYQAFILTISQHTRHFTDLPARSPYKTQGPRCRLCERHNLPEETVIVNGKARCARCGTQLHLWPKPTNVRQAQRRRNGGKQE